MKSFFKRVNRGLILAAVLLIGFIIFVIGDTISFKKCKPEIENAVIEYTDSLAECAVTAESEEEFSKKTEDMLSKYWCSDKISAEKDFFYLMNLGNMRYQLKNIGNEMYSQTQNIGEVTKWEATPYSFQIKKAGTGVASVSFSCDITAEFTGDPYLITPSEIMKVSDFLYGEYKTSSDSMKITLGLHIEIKMRETSDGWKICRSQSWGWEEPQLTIIDSTEGGGRQ